MIRTLISACALLLLGASLPARKAASIHPAQARSGSVGGGDRKEREPSMPKLVHFETYGKMDVEKNLPMPNALYHQLATWATINFAYTYRNEREVAELVSLHAEQHALVAELEVLRTQARPAAQRALDTVWAAIGSGREGAWSEALLLRRERVRVERDVIAREADLERVGVRLELLVGESLPRVSAATAETER